MNELTLSGIQEQDIFLLIIISSLMIFIYNYFGSLPLIISVVGSMSNAWLSKYFFLRSRPIKALFIEHTPSFQSGHSTLCLFMLYYFIYSKSAY